MRSRIANTLAHVATWLRPKAVPAALTGGQWTGTTYTDSYRRQRNPTPNELMAELKGVAWTCASINAAVCASFSPRLFLATHPGQAEARCLTRALYRGEEERLRSAPHLPPYLAKAARLEEILDHPLLTLLLHANPVHNRFDLWELTQLYLEVHGRAFWYIARHPLLGTPTEIWPLPSQNVTPVRRPDSHGVIDAYEYRSGHTAQRFRPEEIIFFRYPDPRDPYLGGLSPLRACFEQASLSSDFAAYKRARFDNSAVPDAVLSPAETIGEEERDRLEAQWNQKFRRGGAGRVLVAESGMKVDVLQHSIGDLALLADLKATKEDITGAFHVPVAFLTGETNLANLQAAEHQHMAKAIGPRLQRRDEKLNEQLVPLFDPTGRLFLASEDPVPVNRDYSLKQQQIDLTYGVVTVNEVRQERGLSPVPWGNAPWLPLNWAPSDLDDRREIAPNRGRNKHD